MSTRLVLSSILVSLLTCSAIAATPISNRPEFVPPQPGSSSSLAQFEGQSVRVPFVANQGQKDSSVAFYAQTFSGTVFVTHHGEIVYSLPGETSSGLALVETVVGGCGGQVTGREQNSTAVNYLKGRDRSKWVSNLPTCNSVDLGQVYPGIDLRLKAYHNNVEKLFTVQPGSDPSLILLEITGAEALQVAEDGRLEVGS